jgi:hypothetical protein
LSDRLRRRAVAVVTVVGMAGRCWAELSGFRLSLAVVIRRLVTRCYSLLRLSLVLPMLMPLPLAMLLRDACCLLLVAAWCWWRSSRSLTCVFGDWLSAVRWVGRRPGVVAVCWLVRGSDGSTVRASASQFGCRLRWSLLLLRALVVLAVAVAAATGVLPLVALAVGFGSSLRRSSSPLRLRQAVVDAFAIAVTVRCCCRSSHSLPSR